MTTQPERILEDNLVKKLQELNHERVIIKDEAALIANLKQQLEKHNGVTFSKAEFAKILNHLNQGSVFDRAKVLRDKFQFTNDEGKPQYIEFLNLEHWCQNEFQVAQQITMTGDRKNRYDVTLLINGLPLVQIELKRRGLEMKEAYNQINRYHRDSYSSGIGLFQYVQIFVISNGVNTKYYANNLLADKKRKESYKQTFFWADKDNKKITNIDEFASAFLEPCHISKMICKYIVLAETDKKLMILRPYQYYAVEAIIDKVKNSTDNGYIWHTTGSGKTLTSFKASQIITKLPQVYKVVFVVDRKDLDYQTAREFNSFSKGSVDSTEDTKTLVKQFNDDTPLIVTTIQKLNTAIKKKTYLNKMEALRDKRIVFIFDECHRSQFGETHKRVTDFFGNYQMFGFTGTPIFADNASKNDLGKRTTKDLFGACLHKYVITDAINDGNVLKFSVEYVGKYKYKDESKNAIDIPVNGIDVKELMESPKRLNEIVDYIITNHDRKTHNRAFTAIFCVSGIDIIAKYYDLFKAKKEAGEHNLKIATIFSYNVNEEDKEENGTLADELEMTGTVNLQSREKLESYMADYNKMFKTKFSTKDSSEFYKYYQDIGKRVKERDIDILLVVNMFLTGFDSKHLNTLYVDKNLKYHGLIQAYSRTNRILDEQKSQGNIVVFRNLKDLTDEAVALFANKDAKEKIFLEPYEHYVKEFNEALDKLKGIVPTVNSVNELKGESEKFEFAQAFRDLMRLKNTLSCFADFEFEDTDIAAQEYADYNSKYLDLYQEVKKGGESDKESILNDVDFALELLHRDEINVDYILQLLAKMQDAEGEDYEAQRKNIINLLGGEAQLRSKKELIERFIQDSMPHIANGSEVAEEFGKYWTKEQEKAFNTIVAEENLDSEKLKQLIEQFTYEQRPPLRDEILSARNEGQPSIRQRKTIAERIKNKMLNFVETFIDGIGGA